jgi:hypothetical protein
MAERRMFAKTIIDSDAFIEMPQSTQLLYFHLSMRADDEGFINNPKSIMRSVGAKDDDINLLIMKKFVIPFESGVVVIKHWKIHNYIQADRLTETKYIKEKSQLELDENKAYRLPKSDVYTECIQDVSKMDTQVSIGKVSIELGKSKVNKDTVRFAKPNLDEIRLYIEEDNLNVDANTFFDYYESNGWVVGKNKMKDWKATLRNWSRKNMQNKPKTSSGSRMLDMLKEMEQQNDTK